MRLRSRAAEPKPSVDESLATSVAGRVEEIVAAAEQTAARLQGEIERLARTEAVSLRAAAEADADRIRSDAEAEATRMRENAQRQVDAWTRERLAEVERLIDALIDAADHLAAPPRPRADARSSKITPMLRTARHR